MELKEFIENALISIMGAVNSVQNKMVGTCV